MVQATLASIRYYCPEVPICLVADGVFDVSDLVAEYNVSVLRIPDLPSAEMRQLIAGNHRAKLAAMWEGPFEFYVWLDSDAIVWGDFTPQVRTDVDFQIFWDDTPIGPEEVPEWLRHFYFNLDALREFDPDFRWQGFFQHCTEPLFVLGSRRTILFVNRAWEALTGVRLAEVRGQVCRRRRAPRPDSPEVLQHALAPPPEALAGKSTRVRRLITAGPGGPCWWDIHFFPVAGPQGLLGIIGRITSVAPQGVSGTVLLPDQQDAAAADVGGVGPGAETEIGVHDHVRMVGRIDGDIVGRKFPGTG